jgi:hypothetical protein
METVSAAATRLLGVPFTMTEETNGADATPLRTYVANLPLNGEQLGRLIAAGAELVGLPMKWAASVDRQGIAEDFQTFKSDFSTKPTFNAIGTVPPELDAWAKASYTKKNPR